MPVSSSESRPAARRSNSRVAVRFALLLLATTVGGWSLAALYQPRVLATAGQHALAGPDPVTASDTFTVRNDGTATGTFSLIALCGGTQTLSDCYSNPGSVTLAPSASQPVVVYYTRSGPLDYPDTLKLVARIVSGSTTFADTGRKVVISRTTYTPYITRYSTQTVSANGRRWWTFQISNKGNTDATYTLSVSCSGALTSCALQTGSTTMSAVVYPGQSVYPMMSFTTGAVGASGQVRLIMTAPPRVSDGVVQADTSNVTFAMADLAYPTLTFEPFSSGIDPGGDYIVPTDTSTTYLDLCDSDGTLATPSFTMSGVTYTALSNVATTTTGCFTSRRLSYKPVFLDGYGELTATVSDGYHTATKTIWFQHDGAPENTPVVTALHPTISLPPNTVSSDTFVVKNQGHQNLTYALLRRCSPGTPACPTNGSSSSVTLAPGASFRMPVTYSVGGVGSSATATLTGTYYGAFDTTSASASFTARAVGTIAPTIAVTPANGTTVTSSPISQVRIDWCDADDALTRHDVTWQGQALPNTYVAATRSGCYAAGTSTYNNLSIDLWQQSLVATATDAAGHTVTTTTSITFSPPLTKFAPKVTPTPDWHLLQASGAVTSADTFTVRNNGSYTASYALGTVCGTRGTLSGCAKDKGAVSLAPGASDNVVVTYTRSGTTDITDSLKLVATYTSPLGGAIADTGRKVVMAPTIQPAPVVKTPQTSYTLSPNVSMTAAWFGVQNTGTAPALMHFAFTASNGFTIRSPVDTMTVQPGQAISPFAGVVAPSSAGVTGTLSLTASYVTMTGQTVSGSANVTLTTSGGSTNPPTIAVTGSSAPLLMPNTVSPVGFTVTNTGSSAAIVSYVRSCTGSAITVCGSLGRTVDTLAASQSATVTMNVTAGSSFPQTGSVTLTATAGSATATASVTVSIGIVSGPLAMAPVGLLNPGTSIARAQCLTIAAGDAGAYECGELRLVHPLPTTTTMSKARAPTLVYVSGQARPVTLVATDVAVDGTICPNQLSATVRFGTADTVQRSVAWTGPCGQRATRRIVVPVDAVARSHATGIYPYKLEVRAVANGTNYTVTDTSGVMAVVNRSSSQFGPGWWIDGVEQLVAVPNRSDQLMWVGGDGSTRLYTQQAGTTTFLVKPTVDRPDTLEQLSGGAGYRRHLRNGAYVEFDGFLRHSATVNAAGHRTQLYWSSSQLDSISLPTASPGNAQARRVYTFSYTSTSGLLASVTAPGPNGPRVTLVSRVVLSGTTDLGITDPGDSAMHYSSDAADRITERKNRMNDGTRYDYDQVSGVLTRVAIDMSRTNGSGDSIRTTFCPAEASSLAACGGAAADPASVRTLVDGPRTDVADTAAFYLTAFGAPQRVVDALGHVTSIERGDSRWPFVATATVQANLHRVEATYTDRGLVDAMRDIDPFGRDPNEVARTQYQWNATFDKVDNVTAPTGEITRFGYSSQGDRIWQEDGRGSMSRTTFAYNANRQLTSIQIPGNAATELQRLEYDPASGNLVREITPQNDTTFYHSDAAGRVDSIASPANDTQRRSESFVFDLADRVLAHRAIGPAVSNPRGTAPAVTQIDTTTYDPEGRPLSTTRRSEPNLAFAGQPQMFWSYDAAGRRLSQQVAGGSYQHWTYDPAGNATTWSSGRASDGVFVVVSTTYDALNRPIHRTIPQVRRSAERGETRVVCQSGPRFPYFSYLTSGSTYDPATQDYCDGTTPLPQPLVIPADAEDFTYDLAGNLETANNNDARVSRDYYPNGALKSETQAIAIFDDLTPLDARFNTHRYRLEYAYDLSGRRLTRTDSIPGCVGCVQTYHYDATTGLLDAISDQGAARGPAQFGFQYDSASRLSVWTANGSTVSNELRYDANGRMRSRSVIGAGMTIYQDDIAYDRSGRIASASIGSQFPEIAGSTTSAYNGLGALAYFSQSRNGLLLDDEFVVDGLGNRISDKRWVDGHYTTHEYRYSKDRLDQVNQVTPWRSGDPPPPEAFQKGDTATTTYGPTGAVEYQFGAAFKFDPIGAGWTIDLLSDVWTWHAYGADERLRVSQRSVADAQTKTRTVFSDYRYDALGRRVAVRTRWDPYCQRAQPECLSTIERTIWDGDQVLMELRTPAGSEVEYTWGNFTGAVRYTHGSGIDEPLAVWKDEVGGLVPHRSWRGTYEAGTPIDQSSGNVTWPAQTQDVFHAPDARFDPIQPSNWIGSIVEGKTDPSGLQYMRNRYYDPKSGRFTQEDPIGLAGGMNLYGFGGGDPINESDPLGLSPEMCPPLCTLPGAAGPAGALIALTAAASATAGEVAAGVEAAAKTVADKLTYKFVTYTRTASDGQVYSGRTSGFGDPQTIVQARANAHPGRLAGFSPAVVDRWATGVEGYAAIRGREQQLIDFHGGAQSDGGTSANIIRGVSRKNPLAGWYDGAATANFGLLPSKP